MCEDAGDMRETDCNPPKIDHPQFLGYTLTAGEYSISDVQNLLGKFLEQSLWQFPRKAIPKLNGVFFSER